MKVKTIIQNYSKGVNVGGEIYKFDSAGICEVKDEVGQMMINKLPKMFFDASVDKVEEKKLTVVEEYNSETISKLREEIEFLKDAQKEQKSVISNKEADIQVWKDKFNDLNGKEGKDQALLQEQVKSLTKEKTMLEFKIMLVESTAEELKVLCVESKYPNTEWEKLKKSELIDFLLQKEGY